MEPYYLSFLSLKSMIDNLKVDVILDSFPADDDNPYNIEVYDMFLSQTGSLPFTERYDIKINNWYYRSFLAELENSFNKLNWEIKRNLKTVPFRESIPSYLEKLTEELINWFNKITEHNIELDSQIQWFYLPQNIDKSFLKSEGLSSTIIDNISSFFKFIKDTSLKMIENIEKSEDQRSDIAGTETPEELFPNVISPSSTTGVLDIYQTALLFDYLKSHRAINPLIASRLAELVAALTGHSEHNIRTDKGFGVIANIYADKTKNQNFKDIPNYNLNTLKDFLQGIIDDIDKQIKKNHPD